MESIPDPRQKDLFDQPVNGVELDRGYHFIEAIFKHSQNVKYLVKCLDRIGLTIDEKCKTDIRNLSIVRINGLWALEVLSMIAAHYSNMYPSFIKAKPDSSFDFSPQEHTGLSDLYSHEEIGRFAYQIMDGARRICKTHKRLIDQFMLRNMDEFMEAIARIGKDIEKVNYDRQ